MTPRVAAGVLVLALALPATAAAQAPPAPAPPAPAPAPAPPPAAGTLAATLSGARVTRAHPLALAGRAVVVSGTVTPYVPNEQVVVRLYKGKRKLSAKAAVLQPAAGGQSGAFAVRIRADRVGPLTVRVEHAATPALAALAAQPVRLTVVRPQAGLGARGPLVRDLQRRLAALRYSVPRSGVYDDGTANAVMAWRKVAGLERSTVATRSVFTGLLAGRGRFRVRHPHDGHHVEARLGKQVLALVDGGQVRRIYHTSSGASASPTIRGRFKVYLKTPGTNAKGMVDSSYFIRGYAIHGYMSVPAYPASHGCLRVPIRNARAIYDWVRTGDVVWVEN